MNLIWNEHVENRARLTGEDLRPFLGKHVAWNLEGTAIVASGDDERAVFLAVEAAGLNPEEVVFAYVPEPNEVMVGGF
jgi:hypothetical protein